MITLLTILLVYFAMILVGFLFRWKLIFHAIKPNPFILYPWKRYEVSFKNVKGWFYREDPIHPVVIYFGGNMENIANNLDRMSLFDNLSFFLVNYPEYNYAPGKLSEKSVFTNALDAYDQIRDFYRVPPSQIFVMGRSLGGAVAAYVASKRQVQGIILVTPFDRIKTLVRRWLIRPLIWMLDPYFKTEKYLKESRAPVLLLSSEKDEMFPKICISNLVKSINQSHFIREIRGANHQDITEFEEYYTAINQFIHERLENFETCKYMNIS